MNRQKLYKYIAKLSNSEKTKKTDAYLHKIDKYAENINQTGGVLTKSPQVYEQIEAMLSGLYVRDDILKRRMDQLPKIDSCANTIEIFDAAENIEKNNGTIIGCFKTLDIGNNDAVQLNELIYQFKKKFHTTSTELFNGSVLSPHDNLLLTNYIFFVLDHAVKCYLEIITNKLLFGAKTSILLQNVKLLYKGGNTTRCLFGCFLNTIRQIMTSHGIQKGFQEVSDLHSKSSIGDWDYYINVNNQELMNAGFDEVELRKLSAHLLRVSHLALTIIADKFNLFIKSHDIQNTYATKIQEVMFGEEFQNHLDTFIKTYNTIAPATFKRFKSLTIDSVVTCGHLITKNSITKKDTQSELQRLSFISSNHPEKSATGDRAKIIMTTPIPFIDPIKKIVLDSPIPSQILNMYLTVSMQKRYLYAKFNLLRQKITTSTHINVAYDELPNIPVVKHLYSMIETIDVSIYDPKDNKYIFQHKYLTRNDPHYCDVLIKKNIASPTFDLPCNIPSANYMFADVACMLFDEALYIWEAQKLIKRLMRLNILTLICKYSDTSNNLNGILDDYITFRDLFMSVSKFSTIDEKLAFLKPHYTIVDTNFAQNGVIKLPKKDVDIRATSKFNRSHLKYLAIKYIKTLIISKYIIDNTSDDYDHYSLCECELQPNRILETRVNELDKFGYVLHVPLSKLYEKIRGTSHSLPPNIPLPIGKIPVMPPFVPNIVIDHLKKYTELEETIISSLNTFCNLLQEMINAGISNTTNKIIYESISLY